MREFVAIQPGDWTCQFYCRRIIYGCPKKFASDDPELGNIPTDSDMIVSHNHSVIPFHSLQLRESTDFQITWHLSHYLSITLSIGPLHISLNSREHVVICFHPFFKYLYESIFQISKFGGKTKPCRTGRKKWQISRDVPRGWVIVTYRVESCMKSDRWGQRRACDVEWIFIIYIVWFKYS